MERKFVDLQNIDLSKAVKASLIDKKFKRLKWITPYNPDPVEEIDLIKDALYKIKNDKRNKMVITHYQFFSFILEKDLNIANRWYFLENNTFPLINHKHFGIYKKHFHHAGQVRLLKPFANMRICLYLTQALGLFL